MFNRIVQTRKALYILHFVLKETAKRKCKWADDRIGLDPKTQTQIQNRSYSKIVLNRQIGPSMRER